MGAVGRWGKAINQAAGGVGIDSADKPQSMLNRIFGLDRSGSNVRTEFIAGLTTFLTMVYIVFVNPQILGNTGMDKGAVFVATCIAAAVSTMVMALYANYPIALAPGMGLNAFFAFSVVLTMKYTWQQALAAVFCSGVIFFLISIFRVREYIINSIPKNLKLAISAGVGLFLGIIALEESKIVVASPATLVTLGDLRNPVAILCLLGLVLITALNYRRIIGGTLIGILIVTVIGIPLGLAKFSGVVAAPPSLAPTFLQLDFSRVMEGSFLIVIFSFLFVDVFDNAGTLIGVTHRAGLTDAEGNLPRMKQALIADSFAAMFGSLIGTSTTTSYIESAAGVAAGGRTGLTAFFVAIFFLRRYSSRRSPAWCRPMRRPRRSCMSPASWRAGSPRSTGTTSPKRRPRWSPRSPCRSPTRSPRASGWASSPMRCASSSPANSPTPSPPCWCWR